VGYMALMWLGFGGALAAVAGALTGLLFVALSVKGDVLSASRNLSSRAAQTLVLFRHQCSSRSCLWLLNQR
jgi:hypothetical protein